MYQDVKKLSKISQFQMLVQSIITVNIITAIKKQLNWKMPMLKYMVNVMNYTNVATTLRGS